MVLDTIRFDDDVEGSMTLYCFFCVCGWVGHQTAGWLDAYINMKPDNRTVIDAEISGPGCKTSARKKANVSLA